MFQMYILALELLHVNIERLIRYLRLTKIVNCLFVTSVIASTRGPCAKHVTVIQLVPHYILYRGIFIPHLYDCTLQRLFVYFYDTIHYYRRTFLFIEFHFKPRLA